LVSGALKTVRFGIEGFSYAILMAILALFIAAGFRPYGQGFLTLFPLSKRPRIRQLGLGSIHVVRRWFFGQVIVLSISATLTAVALLLIGIDYWLLIAALTFILDFIPFIGALITGVFAGLLTLGTAPEKVLWVLLTFIVIQRVEADVLSPIIMKGIVRLPEAHLLVFILFMGLSLGLVGIFIATPIFAVLHYLYNEAYVPWVEVRPPREADHPAERQAR